jgi:bacteriocin-like protein
MGAGWVRKRERGDEMTTKPKSKSKSGAPKQKGKSRELDEKELEKVSGGYLEGAPAGHPMASTSYVKPR